MFGAYPRNIKIFMLKVNAKHSCSKHLKDMQAIYSSLIPLVKHVNAT